MRCPFLLDNFSQGHLVQLDASKAKKKDPNFSDQVRSPEDAGTYTMEKL